MQTLSAICMSLHWCHYRCLCDIVCATFTVSGIDSIHVFWSSGNSSFAILYIFLFVCTLYRVGQIKRCHYIFACNKWTHLQNFMIFGTCKLHKATNGMMPIWCKWMRNTLGSATCIMRFYQLPWALLHGVIFNNSKKYFCVQSNNYSLCIVFSHIPTEFGQTRNSAIRSADPENPNVEPNMKCIGRPLAEIWPFEIFPNEMSVGRRSVGPQYILLTLMSYTPLCYVRNVAREE